MRKVALSTDEYYHILNRGVDKRPIFQDKQDLERFFLSLTAFNFVDPIGSIYEQSRGGPTAKPEAGKNKRLVDIICYCLNHNHYHLLLKQVSDNGISEFMKRLGGGYTWYFNNRHKRNGSLFQGKFKSVHIDSNEYLLHLSAYVNLNNRQDSNFAKSISKSSWEEYLGNEVMPVCDKEIILEQFKSINEYKTFALSSLEDIIQTKALLKNIE